MLRSVSFTLFIMCQIFSPKAEATDCIEGELGKVNVFSMGWNGFIAQKMPQQLLYERALASQNAVGIFEKVLSDPSSTLEGKLYAVCGLRERGNADVIAIPEQDDALKVNVMKADVISRQGYSDLIENIKQQGCDRSR